MPASLHDDAYLIPPRFWRWLGAPLTRAVLLWLLALGIGVQRYQNSQSAFNTPASEPPERQRADGNSGHAEIDFGGQWVMGRMVVEGHAGELYHREHLWNIVREAYPVENGPPGIQADRMRLPQQRQFSNLGPEPLRTDAESMMHWFMGEDSPEWKTLGGIITVMLAPVPFAPGTASLHRAANERLTPSLAAELSKPRIGGALYPPIHAFVMAPFAFNGDPRPSYRVAQLLDLALAYLAGLGIACLARGRIPWSVACMAVLLFPGTRACLDLAQNSTLTMNIVLWGWVLASRGRPLAGGAMWGLLAIKPTWALAFFLVPLLQRRWRFLLAMCIVGASLALATLPVVGVQTWRDWLIVGSEASSLYDKDENWIRLSRDLHGLPRRWMLDFQKPLAERHNPTAALIGWSIWATVFIVTVAISLLRVNRRRFVGLGPAFLFLGAYLCCYRFMYYDALLGLVGVAVLLADLDRFRQPRTLELRTPGHRTTAIGYVNSFPLTMLVLLGLYENMWIAMAIRSTFSFGFLASGGASAPRIEFDTPVHLGLDTLLTLALWARCGLCLLMRDESTLPN